MTKILYLYSEIAGYQIPIFKTFVKVYNAELHVVSWDKNKIKPYLPPSIPGVKYYKRSEFSKYGLLNFCIEINPDIIYISGWMDKEYLYVVKYFRKKGINVIAGFDDKWRGSIRQRIASIIFPFIFKRYFSHAWVAGPYQYEYARRLGFSNNDIIFDLLTANTEAYINNHYNISNWPKAFLYVGNFRKVKGTDILFEAYRIYLNKYMGDWELICVGNGVLESVLTNNKRIKVIPFANETQLTEIAKLASVFILPSRNDQWGVVVHEFTALGMPMLLSENVGARSVFFINNFNGFIFNDNSCSDLAEKMYKFSKMPKSTLNEMSKNSLALSKRISIETSAANFFSLLKVDV